MWAQKNYEGGSSSDGLVEDASTRDGEGATRCTGGRNDAGAHPEERGDPEIPEAEHAVVLSRVRELVGRPGEVVNKAHLYDQLMESVDPSSARQTL